MKTRKRLVWKDQESNVVMGDRLNQGSEREVRVVTMVFWILLSPLLLELGEWLPVCLLPIFRGHLWKDKNQRTGREKWPHYLCTWAVSKPPTAFPFVGVSCKLPC